MRHRLEVHLCDVLRRDVQRPFSGNVHGKAGNSGTDDIQFCDDDSQCTFSVLHDFEPRFLACALRRVDVHRRRRPAVGNRSSCSIQVPGVQARKGVPLEYWEIQAADAFCRRTVLVEFLFRVFNPGTGDTCQ